MPHAIMPEAIMENDEPAYANQGLETIQFHDDSFVSVFAVQKQHVVALPDDIRQRFC